MKNVHLLQVMLGNKRISLKRGMSETSSEQLRKEIDKLEFQIALEKEKNTKPIRL